MIQHPRYSKPKRFLGFDLKFKFETAEAREALIKRLQNTESLELDLCTFMVNVEQTAAVKHPPVSEVPISSTSLSEGLEVEDLNEFIGDNKITMEVSFEDDLWVMDAELKEPVRLTEVDNITEKYDPSSNSLN